MTRVLFVEIDFRLGVDYSPGRTQFPEKGEWYAKKDDLTLRFAGCPVG
jgi:hypothetical protein